jgi:hypothetical protein
MVGDECEEGGEGRRESVKRRGEEKRGRGMW